MDECLPAAPHLSDVIRFNEAIDQAVAESVGHFSAHVDQGRNLLLGMLSHDMRTPLQTMQMTARHLGQLNAGADVSAAVGRLIAAALNYRLCWTTLSISTEQFRSGYERRSFAG
jgi:signal transduction histidine kinase